MIKREATKKLSRIRTMLIYSHMVAYTDDSLDDEEFLILDDFYESVNPPYKYWNFDLFCFDSFEYLYVQQPNRLSKILRVWQLNFLTNYPWKDLSKL